MKVFKIFIILAIFFMGLNLTIVVPSGAQEWPSKPITFIVPTAPGGSVDSMARGLATYMGSALDVPIRIVNRPGAATQVGTTAFLQSSDDGYNILVSTQPYTSNAIILQGAKYKLEDLDFINIEQIDPATITVHADSPYKTLSDLIKAIQSEPGKLAGGTAPLGSQHVGFLLLKEKLNLDFRMVMYTSGGPYRTALLGKHVDFISGTAAGDVSMKPNARVLAIYDDKPFKEWPEAELMNDALKPYGVTMPNLSSSRFVAVHKSFKSKYPERYKKLVEEYKKVFESKGYQRFIKRIGNKDVSRWLGPEKSNAYMQESFNLTLKYKERLSQDK